MKKEPNEEPIIVDAEFEASHDMDKYYKCIREGLAKRAAAIYSDLDVIARNRRAEFAEWVEELEDRGLTVVDD